jgi:thioredoxin reductase (NADPH)
MEKEKLIILGSGPSGLTAAIYAARADLKPLIFEGQNPGGQLMGTTDVENFPGFSDGIMGPQLIANMRTQAQKFGARTVYENVDRVDFSDSENLKLFVGEKMYTAESVIIATGAAARWLNLGQGEERFYGKGYTACATCDGAFFRDKAVAVVGGGDSACEEAMFLTKFASKVYLLHRRDELRASKPMQKRVIENPSIEIIWNTAVTELHGEEKLQSVTLTDTQNGETSLLEIEGLFMAIGHTPNTGFLDGVLETDKAGYLVVGDHTKTSVPSVFVAGDVSDHHYQQAITAAGAGCMAAMDAEHFLAGRG